MMATWLAMLFVALSALPQRLMAQAIVALHEDFNYPVGDLYGQGGWVHNGGNSADPIQVVDKALTYEGYYDNSEGKCVRLGNTKSGEDLQCRFTTDDDGVKTGTLYYSALINVESQPSKGSYVMSLVLRTKTSVVTEGKNGIDLGRLFIDKGTADDEVLVGIERGGSKPEYSATPLKIGQTYLVVVKYKISETGGGTDDVFLYVNPASQSKEPETPNAFIDGINHTGSGVGNYGLQGLVLRQGSIASATAPELYVGSVRVSDTYSGLFGKTEEVKTPTLNASKKNLILGNVYTGDEYSEDIVVSGTNLTGDVTVESSSDAVTVSPASLAAADVMSGDGAKLNIKVKCTEGEQNATVTLKSDGAQDVVIKLSWEAYTIPEVASIKALYGSDIEEGMNYKYTGEAVVTFIDKGASKTIYYLQDTTGAIAVGDDYGMIAETYNVGDKLTGTVLGVQQSFGTLSGVAFNTNLGTVVSTGNVVEPVSATLQQLKESPSDYIQQLVKVDGLKFKDVSDGATFSEGMAQPVFTDGTLEGKLRIFKGTSLIGKAIPTGDINLTGLFTSAAQLIIGARSADDIEEKELVGDPTFSVSPTKFEMTAGVVGKTTEAARIHVSAQNMPAAIFLELTGANSGQFELSQTKIEKGNSETDIIVTYAPTEIAKHKAYLTIDCPSLPELAQTISLSAYAIDEQNPPVVTVEPQTLNKFTAKVGESQEQTITINSANMPDYAYLKVKEPGSFILSTTMLLRNTSTAVKVTFKPNAAGNYSNEIIISSLGMEDVAIPVEGTAIDQSEEPEKEGDEFSLSTENPLTELNEHFDNIERNKPLQITGWTNSAIEGTRAWWGYSFLDYDASAGEKVAKVTAYDSKLEDDDESPATMMLVTPALDFKNSKSKMFTFRVRGDYLQDNQTDKLELCYLDFADDSLYIAPVGGFTMPCTKDESGEWFEFHVDLTDLDIADVFFMGFRFTSTRGHNNTATYYIDDVTYGRTDIPVIRPSVTELALETQPGKDVVSDLISVATENTTEPVKLTLGGANKSKFNLSTDELPSDGGTFTVAFNAFDEGIYSAYVKLASKGAADKYIELAVNNAESTAISDIDATPAHVTIYDLSGNIVAEKSLSTPAEAASGLAKGVYVVKTANANRIAINKVYVK